jgi:hypothetical protein
MPRKDRQLWSTEDIALLKKLLEQDAPNVELTLKLGRTMKSIHKAKAKFGIKRIKNTTFSESD